MSDGATIFALSSPPGRGGVAVFRISGPKASVAFDLFHVKQPDARRAARVYLREEREGPVIDDALALWFPGPHSFTGEDCAELHTHSGRAIINRVLDLLSTMPGFRPAEAGEFTKRAFGFGKIDLIEAEGLADLIDAETEAQRKQAMRQFTGQLSTIYGDWQSRIADSLAFLEAVIDFGDEEDVSEAQPGLQKEVLQDILSEMVVHLDDGGRGEILRNGFRVALVGEPNVGKSSLLNVLAKREAAIVSDQAGTTRDRVEVDLDIAGVPVRLIDTAGLRESDDLIEQEGIRRSQEAARSADLILHILAPEENHADGGGGRGSKGNSPGFDGLVDLKDGTIQAPILTILNKGDLPHIRSQTREEALLVSAVTGEGISDLLSVFEERLKLLSGSEDPAITRARHRDAVNAAVSSIQQALKLEDRILAAEELRRAAFALGRVVGRLDVEQLLDRIFSQFCIGK